MSVSNSEAIERRLTAVESRLAVLEDIDDRIDDHDKELDSIRSELRGLKRELSLCRSDVGRVSDAMTGQMLVLNRVHSLLEQLVRQQTPSVEVLADE